MPRKYPEYPIVGVAGVAIKERKILLIKRLGEPGKNLWSLPGGVVELGERITDALKREIKEETGLDCDVGDLVNIAEVIIRDTEGRVMYHYIILDYLINVSSEEVKPSSDVSDAGWFSYEEAKRLKLTPPTANLIEKLRGMKLL